MNTLSKNRKTARSVVAVLTAAALLVTSWFAFPLMGATGNGGNGAFEVYADVSDYNAGDIAIINTIIEDYGLDMKPNAPTEWTFVKWDDNEQDKRVTELNFYLSYHWSTDTLDVSGLTSLKRLDGPVGLTGLNVSGLTSLESLTCARGELTTLDVSTLTSLKSLDCSYNKLTALDVSGLSTIESLNCSLNELTSLTVTGCTSLESLSCSHNYLSEIIGINDCTSLASFALNNQDSKNVSDYNAGDVAVINSIISMNKWDAPQNEPWEWRQFIDWEDSAEGKRITRLATTGDEMAGTLDVSGLSSLKSLYCDSTNYTGLNVSGLTSLELIVCYNSKLTTLDVSGLSSLKSLVCSLNELTSLTVTGCTSLNFISCERNFLSEIIGIADTLISDFVPNHQNSKNVSDYNAGDVAVINAIITTNEWDMPQNEPWEWRESINWEDSVEGKRITDLSLPSWSNLTGTLDVSGLSLLGTLSCGYFNSFTGLNVSGLTLLSSLDCVNNRLTTLDVSGLTSLSSLDCSDNELTSINVTGCSALRYFFCANNYLSSESAITGLDNIKSDLNNFEFEPQDSLDISAYNAGDVAVINQIISENGLNESPNAVAKWDFATWEDSADGKRITGLDGLYGRKLTGTLDVSGLTSLKYIGCSSNNLTGLNVSGLTLLESILCYNNGLTTLDVSGLTSLEFIGCSGNKLTVLDASGLSSLQTFYCDENELTSIDVTGCTALEWLHCADNDLPSQSAIIGLEDIRGNLELEYSPQNVPQIMTVTFDPNGGDALSPENASKPVTQGETYGELPTPTRSGYTFAGWFTAATNGTKITSASEVTETTNHTLYAQWTAVAPPPVNPPPTATTYAVTVTNGAGSGPFEEGATVSITANAAPDGKVFDAWTTSDVTLTDATKESTTFTMPAKAVAVTATYKDDPNAGSGDPDDPNNPDDPGNPNPPDNSPQAENGWVKNDDGEWEYLTDGEAKTGWLYDTNYKAWYYLASNGVMQTGWDYVGGKWYYLASNGKMQTGWVKDGNAWYYLSGNGAMVANKWLKDADGKWYYLAGSGKMLTGKHNISGKAYTFKANGVWIG